jgi:hypothetical protein
MGPFSAQIQRFARSFAPYIGGTGLRYTPGGRIAQVVVPVTNAADTDFVFMPLIVPIPANTLANNGDMLEVRTQFTLSAATSTRTYSLNLGYTATGAAGFTGGIGIFSNGTTVASSDIVSRAYILRLAAGSTAYWVENQLVTNGAVQGTQRTTSAGVTWTNAINLGLGVKDATGNAAAIIIQYSEVWFYPALLT